VIGAPSRLRLTRKAAALARMLPTLDLSCAETAARRMRFWGTVPCLKLLSKRECDVGAHRALMQCGQKGYFEQHNRWCGGMRPRDLNSEVRLASVLSARNCEKRSLLQLLAQTGLIG
jgi:hypothetical protein